MVEVLKRGGVLFLQVICFTASGQRIGIIWSELYGPVEAFDGRRRLVMRELSDAQIIVRAGNLGSKLRC
jgi:hypothetical protein